MRRAVREDSAREFKREQRAVEAEPPERPTVEVQRLVLAELADYCGTLAVEGFELPAETRDALQAAYEALDRPGLPLAYHDCPDDGAALDVMADDPLLPDHISPLECPECGEVWLLDTETGDLARDD